MLTASLPSTGLPQKPSSGTGSAFSPTRPKPSNPPNSESDIMRSAWPSFKARVSNRLARHLHAAPLRLAGTPPMVSFTFDDVPESAASIGAPMLEEYGGRATFYHSGGLVGQWSGYRNGIAPDDIVALHRSGHKIACHTFSHRQAIELNASAMATSSIKTVATSPRSTQPSGSRTSPIRMGSPPSRARAS